MSVEAAEIKALELNAAKGRRNVVRMIESSHAGHLGGALSAMDVVTALYFRTMKGDPAHPDLPDRDRFLLSAGHKCMVQYAVLALKGYFPEEVLDTYGKLKSPIPGHPDMHKLPGIEANTGALGHGLSIANGMAMGAQQLGLDSRVFAVMGDGELPEGSNWEAAAAAAHHKLDNLVAIVDNNGLQIGGRVEDLMNMSSIAAKFTAFGWEAREIDGNDMATVVETLDATPFAPGKPSVIVAHTIKSKGLDFAEDSAPYHYWKPKDDELERAISQLDAKIAELEAEAVR